MNALTFDIYAEIARWSQPKSFVKLSRTCRRFYKWRNHSHILQQFNSVPIDRHLEDGHVALLKYKHEKGLKCSYLSSARAVTLALEGNYCSMLLYLFSLGKMVEGAYVIQLAAKRTERHVLTPIIHNVVDQRALLRAAINQGNADMAARFSPQQLVSVLLTISINAERVISRCVADNVDWDYFLEMLIVQREYGPKRSIFNNPNNEGHLLSALLRKYPKYRTAATRFEPAASTTRQVSRSLVKLTLTLRRVKFGPGWETMLDISSYTE